MKHYVHEIPGRLRVRSATLRRNEANAASVRAFVESLPGVRSAVVNTLTGSLTVLYDPEMLPSAELRQAIRSKGISADAPAPRRAPRLEFESEFARRVAKKAANAALEAVIERSVVALVAALI